VSLKPKINKRPKSHLSLVMH